MSDWFEKQCADAKTRVAAWPKGTAVVASASLPDFVALREHIATLERELAEAMAREWRLSALLRQASEAMAWNLGGEPIDTLMIKASKDIDGYLQQKGDTNADV